MPEMRKDIIRNGEELVPDASGRLTDNRGNFYDEKGLLIEEAKSSEWIAVKNRYPKLDINSDLFNFYLRQEKLKNKSPKRRKK